ncbi:hypothetical protein AWB94_29315 [Mycolicibacterium canariasense]|nr:hypothetical protein AWB94_29315 [Mycolicibacterium canariasense]
METTPETTTAAVPAEVVVTAAPAAAAAVPPEPTPAATAEPAPEAEVDKAAVAEWLEAEKIWQWLRAEKANWKHPDGWQYDWVTFKGDQLAIKIPSKGMINAIAHAGTTSLEFQTRLVRDFETTHISEASRERVIARLMDPEDPEYTGEEWDELQSKVLELGAERVQKDAEELAKVKG